MTELVEQNVNVTDRLERVFLQSLDLLERQAQDRQLLLKEKDEFGKLTQLLINQTKEIGRYEMGIRKRIQDCIKESAQNAGKLIEESVMKQNQQSIEKLIQDISKINSESMSAIRATQSKESPSMWLIISTAIIGSIASSLFIFYLLLPEPVIPLTQEQISLLHKGQALEAVWAKLSKKEKEHIDAMFTKFQS